LPWQPSPRTSVFPRARGGVSLARSTRGCSR
jgi:hypothetical protein